MLIHGNTSDPKMLPLLVDSSGRAIVVAPTNGMEVKPPFGNFWSAIKDSVKELVVNTALAAGINYVQCSVVPAGYIYEIECVGVAYVGTVAAVKMWPNLYDGVNYYPLNTISPPVSGQWYIVNGRWTLKAGERVVMSITGATLNDDAYVYFTGRKIAVA